MADGSRSSLYLIAESTYGTTPPTTPAFIYVRTTGNSPGVSKDSMVSDELRSDRQIADFQYGVRQVGGDISAELSYGGAIDTLLEAALMGTWTTNVVKGGVARRSFSLLRHFEDLGAGEGPYHLFKGVEVNTVNVTNTANGKVGLSFGLLGQNQADPTDTAPTGAVLGSPTTTDMMTGILGSINENGSAISIVTDVDFTLENGLEIRPVIGSNLTLQPSVGRSNATGNMTAYFESAALLQKFLDETASSLDFTCVDAAGNSYKFEFPNIKYTGGQPDVSGQGTISISLPWQAIYDTTDDTNILITRTPA